MFEFCQFVSILNLSQFFAVEKLSLHREEFSPEQVTLGWPQGVTLICLHSTRVFTPMDMIRHLKNRMCVNPLFHSGTFRRT